MTSALLRLKDGRKLSYAEYGSSQGFPVIGLHGTPGSRMVSDEDIACAIKSGVRFILPERPGYGLSDFKTYETAVDWVDDLVELVDALHLERFGLFGGSGGTPFAAACAVKLANRITRVAIASSIAPIEALETPPQISPREILETQAQSMAERAKSGREAILQWFDEMFAAAPESDRRTLAHTAVQKWLADTITEAFRSGSDGLIQDWQVQSRPWGVELKDIQLPVRILQGETDRLEAAHYLVRQIPNSKLTVIPEAGHLLTPDFTCDIFAYLTEL